MSLNKKIIISIVLIILAVAGSYLLENLSKERGLKSATVIKMQENNNLVALMGVDVLKTLKDQESPGDKDAKGLSLLYAMGAAGIGEFNQIEVKGVDNKSVFQANKNEITRDYLLYFTDHGTVNLCRKNDYQRFLVEDVSEINKIN
ncbi:MULTISPECIES: hypothetical protein [Pelotomaculum]|uniref:Uncharacterized protein n=1 Tax=Pelotomaculum isophthalicicum JI TaxID=947010 RepID=A0A9X4H051_9FIRM|nr:MULTISPECIES: hypothetical protein [Pelotomaculum]MDF9409515.1 hypothetical protein [Pelotomaculum isophthalicicum JI]OPX91634.1 MAG: hypothetical protein A4E54_00180 [Pelotomaculum sp. PtaB.Bin117]